MLDLGVSEQADLTEDPAEGLVAELTARAAEGGAPAQAAAEIRRRGAAGETPIGLYRLSEVLTAQAAGVPAQRLPADEPGEVVDVVRQYPCAVLDAADPGKVAENLAAVLLDGKRALVTGPDAEALSAVRAALPEPLRGLCLDAPPPLSDAELRELRSLLVTATPRTRHRLGQVLPQPDLVPSADQVAALCRAAGGKGHPGQDGVDLLPELLGQLDSNRLAALVETARRCQTTMAVIDPRGDAQWTRALLERVLFGPDRAEFDGLLRLTTDVVLSADKLRDAGDQMALLGALPPDAVEQLRNYVNYLDSGGRARMYFRSAQQRAVRPVLRQLRLDGTSMRDSTVLHQALAFVELIEAMDEIAARCRRMRVPEPGHVPAVAELNRQLDRVEEAARATEHLRHEVLFIDPDSPVTVHDLPTAERVARTIAETGGESAMTKAREQLLALADRLQRSVPAEEAAPELDPLVAALREMSLPAYLDALAVLAAARREQTDQRRQAELLGRLRAAAPALAEAWEEAGPRRFTQGTARFLPLDELLGTLPAADTADLVLLLGAGTLGAENLLVLGAAPRLLAVPAAFAAATGAGQPDGAEAEETVLSRLRRAGVPVILAGGDGASAEPVVATPPAEPPAAPAPVAYVEMPAPPPGVTEVPPPPLDLAEPADFAEPAAFTEPAVAVAERAKLTEPAVAVAQAAAPSPGSPESPTSGDREVDGPTLPVTVPAQREAPAEEADPSSRHRRGTPSARRRGAGEPNDAEPAGESAGEPEVETEYVVLPLGIVARPVEPAGDRAGGEQRAGA